MLEFSPEQVAALTELTAPDRFSTGQSNRELHRHDISSHDGQLPAGVIWPTSTDEVSRILAWCYQNDVPVTPWGAGTSTEGNPVPNRGGLVMDLVQMDAILALRPQDLQADVQPGVLRKSLNKAAKAHGLFFPPDPGADATIGGMIANNASGVRTVKYGATKDYIHRLTIVLPQGEVIHTGSLARKSSSGYDLTRLFVGSEGTLGVVTEASVRLVGLPAHHLAATIAFNDLASATAAVASIIAYGLDVAALELLTPALIELMNREADLGLAETPTLFCEFHGITRAVLDETAALVEEVCRDHGAGQLQFAFEEKDRLELWRARHEAAETIIRAHPGLKMVIVDVAVPISGYPDMVVFSQEEVDRTGAIGYVLGHAGDGNLHVVLVGDPEDQAQWETMELVNHNIVDRAIALGGTATGEHGIGLGKRKFMAQEHGAGYDLMKRIKELVDPKGLMNPDKIFS